MFSLKNPFQLLRKSTQHPVHSLQHPTVSKDYYHIIHHHHQGCHPPTAESLTALTACFLAVTPPVSFVSSRVSFLSFSISVSDCPSLSCTNDPFPSWLKSNRRDVFPPKVFGSSPSSCVSSSSSSVCSKSVISAEWSLSTESIWQSFFVCEDFLFEIFFWRLRLMKQD